MMMMMTAAAKMSQISVVVCTVSDVAFPTFSSQGFTERGTPAFLEGARLLFFCECDDCCLWLSRKLNLLWCYTAEKPRWKIRTDCASPVISNLIVYSCCHLALAIDETKWKPQQIVRMKWHKDCISSAVGRLIMSHDQLQLHVTDFAC